MKITFDRPMLVKDQVITHLGEKYRRTEDSKGNVEWETISLEGELGDAEEAALEAEYQIMLTNELNGKS